MAIIRKSEYYAKKREYYQKNKQAMLVYQHEYQRKRRFEWHEGIKSTPEIQRRAEELADNILGAHGFVDVQRMLYTFSFDYLARKDGGLLAIEVTTSRTKRFLKRIHSRHPDTRKDFTWRLDLDRIELAKLIGARIAVLFVTPSLKRYFLLLDPMFREGKTANYKSAQIQGTLSEVS